MHREASLVSLAQQRKVQLLGLMVIYKHNADVERIFARNIRQGNRYNLKVNYQGTKYKRSPYFKAYIPP